MPWLLFLAFLFPQETRKPQIEVSPDGRWAAVLDSRGGIRLWATENPIAAKNLPGDTDPPAQALDFSPDGAILVSGHRGGLVRVWDVPKRLQLRSFQGDADLKEIRSLAVLPPDGAALIVGGSDGILRRFDLQSGRELLRSAPKDFDAGASLWSSRDGRTLAALSSDRRLLLLDPRSLASRKAPELRLDANAELAFSPDGRSLCATTADKQLVIVDLLHGKTLPLFHPAAGRIETLAFDGKGEQLVTLDQKGTLRRFDARSMKELSSTPTPLTRVGDKTAARLSPDGTRLATFEENSLTAPVTINTLDGPSALVEPAAGPEKFVRVPLFFGTNRQPRGVEGSLAWHALRFVLTGGGLKFIAVVALLLAISATLTGPIRKLWNQPTISAKQAFLVVGLFSLATLLGWVLCTKLLSFRHLDEILFSLGILSVVPLSFLVLMRCDDRAGLRIVCLLGMGLLLVAAGALLDGAVQRKTESAGRVQHFNAENAGNLIVGTCEVTVPLDTHRRGLIDRPVVAGLQFELPDPDKHMIVADVQMEDFGSLLGKMRDRVQTAPRKEAFVFVHGYNVTFEDAALRTAQIAHDIEFPGLPIFFSWPSQGTVAGYPWDSDAVDVATAYFEDFLKTVALESGAEVIHLIAHSMGNRLLTRALKELCLRPDGERIRKPFREVILAAPDISATVFETQYVDTLVQHLPHVTLYANSNDRALMASRAYNHSRRAGDSGDAEICVFKKLDSIDVSTLDTDMDGHGYFGTNHVVLCDMDALIKEGKPAEARYRMEARSRNGLPYYLFSQ